ERRAAAAAEWARHVPLGARIEDRQQLSRPNVAHRPDRPPWDVDGEVRIAAVVQKIEADGIVDVRADADLHRLVGRTWKDAAATPGADHGPLRNRSGGDEPRSHGGMARLAKKGD